MNIGSYFVDAPASRYPSRRALIDGLGGTVTYQELLALTNRAANALIDRGCRSGDRVLIAVNDSKEFVASFFGCAKAGLIPALVGMPARSEDFVHYLSEINPRAAIVDASLLTKFRRASEERPLETIVCGSTSSNLGDTESDWMVLVSQADDNFDSRSAENAAIILYTSGSTNRQKAVVHSHANFLAAQRNVADAVFGFRADDRILSIPRLHFSFGLGFGMCFPLAAGATTLLVSERPGLEEAARLISAYSPTILIGVPSFFSILLKKASATRLHLRSLRFAVSAGEALNPAICEGFRNHFGLELIDGLGSTEMLTHFISNRPGQTRPGSCGTEVPGCNVRLLDENRKEVAQGEIGTLWVRSHTSFVGYWNKPELTEHIRDGEWVTTGDLLYRDAEGYYFHRGRNDDIIKVSGMWVVPTDIELVLCTHPDIDSAAVIPYEDGVGNRRLAAYVVTLPGVLISAVTLLKYLADRLTIHMLPGAIVMIPKLPLTENGKLDRRALPRPGAK